MAVNYCNTSYQDAQKDTMARFMDDLEHLEELDRDELADLRVACASIVDVSARTGAVRHDEGGLNMNITVYLGANTGNDPAFLPRCRSWATGLAPTDTRWYTAGPNRA
ncbi:MAG: hypothetical protein ACLU0O_11220 [Collinsella sp.]